MNTRTLLCLGMMLFLGAGRAVAGLEAVLPPFQETPAYQQYQKRPKSELSKILYLMDRFKQAPVIVIYDRVEYESEIALKHAKSYVAKHYHRQDAAEWIRENAYRSVNGSVIYLKAPDGEKRVLRDVLIEELQKVQP
jgi:hypothetical protein